MLTFYINGQRCDRATAHANVHAAALLQGHAAPSYAEFMQTARTEEGREHINALSRYVVECFDEEE